MFCPISAGKVELRVLNKCTLYGTIQKLLGSCPLMLRVGRLCKVCHSDRSCGNSGAPTNPVGMHSHTSYRNYMFPYTLREWYEESCWNTFYLVSNICSCDQASLGSSVIECHTKIGTNTVGLLFPHIGHNDILFLASCQVYTLPSIILPG